MPSTRGRCASAVCASEDHPENQARQAAQIGCRLEIPLKKFHIYLGACISCENFEKQNMLHRLQACRAAFCRLRHFDGAQGAQHAQTPRAVEGHREKLKVPPRPFPLEEHSHYNHSGQLQVFFTQLEPNSHGVRQSSHASVETSSNKRISVLGTNHTKIYRVNLVGFKHSAEDPSRSPHHQNKYTLRSKRFSNVLSKHQGRFPETVPEAKHSQTEVLITSD